MPERILKLLKDPRGPRGETPGPELSRALGVTRTAVWKKIKRLRADGYQIHASKSGYRLISGPELSAFELAYYLPGVKIVYRESVSSTNDLALEMAFRAMTVPGESEKSASGEKATRPPLADKRPLSALVVADSQTAGRGRLGRRWLSPPAVNIYMSVVLWPELPPRKTPLLALAAGLASALAIKGQTGLEVRLKWPNDLLALPGKKADGRCKKLGGILLEFRSDPDRVLIAVAGIGINANLKKSDLPKGTKNSATSILAETGRRVNRAALAAAVYKELDYWTGMLGKGARAEAHLLKGYRSLCDTIGKRIRVQTEGKSFSGTATGIDDGGRLALKTPAGLLVFSTGEVHSVRDEADE
ncbi:MAG: biotin--[acetyl-CoA-carboxylase] ligase [Nitrospiraceae bacterium]|nr:biotin--[acetyl-CoA-carboxylase] ligase [Nitrospiraceae bacterium]